MNYNRLFGFILGAALPVAAAAQHYADPDPKALKRDEAQLLMDNGHYYYASLLLQETGDVAGRLVCEYFLNRKGTAERIKAWTGDNPLEPETNRLKLMEANLYVRDKLYDRALDIYRKRNTDNVPLSELTEAQLNEAIVYIETRQYEPARRLLTTLRERQTHRSDILYYICYVNYMDGYYKEAIRDFAKLAKNSRYASQVQVYEADCHLNSGNASKALTLIRRYRTSRRHPELALEAKRIEGEALYQTGKYYDAINALTAYTYKVQQPKRTALYKLGMCYLKTDNYDKAAENLVAGAGDEPCAMAQNAWLNAGIAYVKLKRTDQARMAFQQAAGMEYDRKAQEEALYNYALTQHDGQTMGFGEGVRTLEQFLNQFPDSKYKHTVSRHLQELYLQQGNAEEALASISKIENPDKDMLATKQHILYNLGVNQFRKADYAAARQLMQQSLQAQDNTECYYWLGETAYRLGKYRQAAKDFKTYLDRADAQAANRPLAQYGMGYALFKLKEYTEAQACFSAFLRQNTAAQTAAGGSASLQADALNRMADCLFTQRKYNEAYAAYQKVRDTHAAQADYALLQQAFIAGLKGDYDRKVALLSNFHGTYAASPLNADALYEQGRAYVQKNDAANALNAYRTLQERYPKSTAAQKAGNEIGLVYFTQGNMDLAVKAYRQVVADFPKSEAAQTALANLKDIYTRQGRVDEYAAVAATAGNPVSAEELDRLTDEAALRALTDGQYRLALTHYTQLEAQTASDEMRAKALTGQLRAAMALDDDETVIATAGKILQPGTKLPLETLQEARLDRAHRYMKKGQADKAVADLNYLAEDSVTVYGAQATVELAQYAFDTRQYEGAEQLIMQFTDKGTTYDYWLARAFVLLADVYAQTDRKIEAKQYLLSLKANYPDNEEINRMVDERLGKLN